MSKASVRASIFLKEKSHAGFSRDDDWQKEPEPEHPEAFCKRYGVRMIYRNSRGDAGLRIHKFCEKDHAFLDFKRHTSLEKFLQSLDYQELV